MHTSVMGKRGAANVRLGGDVKVNRQRASVKLGRSANRITGPRSSNRGVLKCRAVMQPKEPKDEEKKGSAPGMTKLLQSSMVALQRLGGNKGVPVANAQYDDIKDLLGGALFLPLYKWMEESGPCYLLPTGPVTNFLVLSDPDMAKHVLRDYTNYQKGLVSEISNFLFGDGFATAEGDLWKARRKAVGPSLHKQYLETMVDRNFSECGLQLNRKLAVHAENGTSFDMEANFSQVTLDVIGKALFNYDFDSLNNESPVIQAVYASLKEVESRATALLPIWKLPDPLRLLFPKQRKAQDAVNVIRDTCSMLIANCKEMVDAEGTIDFSEEYMNDQDPSILRFLLASRDETTSTQLRDDLLSMLVAGHETTGSVLTWTVYLLATHPDKLAKCHSEIDRVLAGKATPSYEDTKQLQYTMRCINESMRLYPHPPVLIRRAGKDDTLPGGWPVKKDQDVMISVYNIHRSPAVWDNPHAFEPERFGPLDGPIPNEQNTSFKYIPFSGGQRKCVGDTFALLEAVTLLSVLLKEYTVNLVPGQDIQMTTGATIHTLNGLFMTVDKRVPAKVEVANVVENVV